MGFLDCNGDEVIETFCSHSYTAENGDIFTFEIAVTECEVMSTIFTPIKLPRYSLYIKRGDHINAVEEGSIIATTTVLSKNGVDRKRVFKDLELFALTTADLKGWERDFIREEMKEYY
jgi:hypothetical protein